MENPNMTYYGVCNDCPDNELRSLKWLYAHGDTEYSLILTAANTVDEMIKEQPCPGRDNPEQECQLPVRDLAVHVMIGALVLRDRQSSVSTRRR